jgi:hypothetical protein
VIFFAAIAVLLFLRFVACTARSSYEEYEGYGDSQWEEVPLLVREPAWVSGKIAVLPPPAPVSDFDACMAEYIRTGDVEWMELALSELE